MNELNELARKCDAAILDRDKSELENLVTPLNEAIDSASSDWVRGYANYLLGNVYFELSIIAEESASGWRHDNYPANLTYAINHFRRAKELAQHQAGELQDRVTTNLANALAHQRRSYEALEDWRTHFSSDDGDAPFVSARSKAKELLFISHWLNDPSHTQLYRYEAYLVLKRLQNNLKNTDHPKIVACLHEDEELSGLLKYGEELSKHLADWEKQHPTPSYGSDERKYRAWCLNHSLFANPINDLTQEWIADQDILQFPNHTVSLRQGPFFSAAFSVLKREYCFARHMAFEGINQIHPSYENKKLFLTDTLDCVSYGGDVEKIKTAFRICFSVLDSLAELMNAYFECKSTQAAFTSRWIKDCFKDRYINYFVDALYWLSCDLFDNEEVINNPAKWRAPNPSASKIRAIRNAIEHGWLRVADSDNAVWDNDNDFAYIISSESLKKHTLFLLKLVRSAMMYLCLAVKYNENQKDKPGHLSLPSFVPTIDDDLGFV